LADAQGSFLCYTVGVESSGNPLTQEKRSEPDNRWEVVHKKQIDPWEVMMHVLGSLLAPLVGQV